MNTKYQQAVEMLTSKGKFYICLGLERVSAVLDLLGNPQNKLKIIHTAGTNGKGSVCAILSNILMKAGFKTGLYTSPHLVRYTERIKINNKEISEEDFSSYIFEVCKIASDNNIHLTEFEILTVCAYKYFFDKKIDIAVIETGLGGRLDATNTADSVLCSVITSVSIDHKDRLGDTIDKIAAEKAGIIKTSCDVIVSHKNQGLDVIVKTAQDRNAIIHRTAQEVKISFENGVNKVEYNDNFYEFNLLGLYQKDNLQLVFKIVEILRHKNIIISEEAIAEGLRTVEWKARLQFIKEKSVIIDGAHNCDGAKALIESLDFYFPNKKRIWIYGSLKTKQYEKITKILFKPIDKLYLYDFKHNLAVKLIDLKSCSNFEFETADLIKTENILDFHSENSVKIISGSLYMIGEICNSLNL